MNTFRKSIVVGLTVLGLAGSTFAVQAQENKAPVTADKPAHAKGHEHGHPHAHKHANRAERQAQRAQKLHDALKLSPAQETAWASYSAAIKPAARPQRGQQGDWKAMTAPQRMEMRLARAKLKLERMEARVAATTTFYGTLSPEQKKLFDENTVRGGGHRHHMKHMKHGMAS
jgi:periplasmic protein CpxP/Spy